MCKLLLLALLLPLLCWAQSYLIEEHHTTISCIAHAPIDTVFIDTLTTLPCPMRGKYFAIPDGWDDETMKQWYRIIAAPPDALFQYGAKVMCRKVRRRGRSVPNEEDVLWGNPNNAGAWIFIIDEIWILGSLCKSDPEYIYMRYGGEYWYKFPKINN